MSKIKGKNTKPEIKLRSSLFKLGYRYRLHSKILPGRPDIVLPKYRTVIFVHGCFWHYHKKCRDGRIPRSNTLFWQNKLSTNVQRDKNNIQKLKSIGWNVIVVWECEIEAHLPKSIKKILSILKD